MPRPKNLIPEYKRGPNGYARVWLNNKWKSLGVHNTPDSLRRYADLVANLRGEPLAPTVADAPSDKITVAELLVLFTRHVAQHYRAPDGKPTSEVNNYKVSLRVLKDMFAALPAAQFSPLKLKAVRERMIGLKWVRTQINARVGRIRRMFKWAAENELVSGSVPVALAAVAGLQMGRTAAKDRPPVAPVADGVVEATLPFLNRHVRGMVEFQRLTGCRPGEVCALRLCDIDRSTPVWKYRPPHHKTAWRGKERTVNIGPRAQAVLAAFPTANPGDCVFSPRRAVAELHANRAANRQTPLYPSHARRNADRPKTEPNHAEQYSVTAYDRAVRRAAEKAKQPHWKPNQLRHAFGTAVRIAKGLEAAQHALGHAHAKVSEIYAARNDTLAAAIASEIG